MGFGFSFIEVIVEDFPSNSIKKNISEAASTEDNTTPPKSERLQKVTTAKPARKTFGQSFRDVFLVEGRSFANYLLHEIIIPDVKDVIASAVRQSLSGIGEAIETKVSGGSTRRKPMTSHGAGRTNYSAYSRSTTTSTTRREREEARPMVRRSNVVEKVRVDTRELGNEILQHLEGKIESTGFATVGDFYELVGDITPRSTDDDWGWGEEEIARSSVQRIGIDGYVIKMAPPVEIPR
jgi:hypothetical protein